MLSNILLTLFLWIITTDLCSSDTAVDEMKIAIDSIQLYPYMKISLNLRLASIPSSSTTILAMHSSMKSFLSMFVSPENILQIQIQNHFMQQHSIHLNTSYSMNITLHPSNNYYTFHVSSSAMSETFHFTLDSSPSQYASSYSLSVNNDYAQIGNLHITTFELNDDDKVLAVDITTTPAADEYESIFGPNITKQQELIIVISVVVIVICMVLFIAIAVLRKCVKRKRRNTEHEQSYEHVNGTTPVGVHYLDETPGNHDIENIPFGIVKVDSIANERTECEGHAANTLTTTATVTATATATTRHTTAVYEIHEDSIEAMDI